MKLWWYNNPPNYGDILTPYIMAHYGFRFEYSERNKADALCVGSIAKWARPGMMGLGSGFIDTADPVCRDADYRFVRVMVLTAKWGDQDWIYKWPQ